VKFSKPPLTLSQQLAKWQSRGLVVADTAKALHYLKFIGYYRFSAYTLPFQDPAHHDKHFRSGTTFEQVLELYVFDRELRLLVLDAIERAEVAVRTCLVNEMSTRHGAHWFIEARHFGGRFDHNRFLDKIDKELGIAAGARRPSRQHSEVFINHYYAKYTSPDLPPGWMVFEVLPLGTMSLVLANLANVSDRKAVALPFGIDEQVLTSWLHCLSYIRNVCAHHSRLWNRQLVIKPLVAKKHAALVPVRDRFYAVAVMLHYMLGLTAPKSSWHERLARLVDGQPAGNLRVMGFPAGWKAVPFWGFSTEDFAI